MKDQIKPVRKFHFLAAVQIVFSTPAEDGSDANHAVMVNTVVLTDTDTIPTRALAQIQQGAQMQLFKKLGEETFAKTKVLDVITLNIVNLGYMTEEEFHAAPSGAELKEKLDTVKTALKVVK